MSENQQPVDGKWTASIRYCHPGKLSSLYLCLDGGFKRMVSGGAQDRPRWVTYIKSNQQQKKIHTYGCTFFCVPGRRYRHSVLLCLSSESCCRVVVWLVEQWMSRHNTHGHQIKYLSTEMLNVEEEERWQRWQYLEWTSFPTLFSHTNS